MLITLWVIDALLLLSALGLALLARGVNAAGRGILWVVPAVVALALAGSFFANRSDALPLALGLAIVGPAITIGVLLTLGKSLLIARQEQSGAAYWSEQRQHQLVRAIVNGDTVAMQAAVSAGAQMNQVGKFGMTVLDFTITHRPDMVAAVLGLGADLNLEVPGHLTPLMQATNASDFALLQLVEGGANPDALGEDESPIIFSAIRSHHVRSYESLVAHGADVHCVDVTGRSTIMAAVESALWTIARDLLSRGVDTTIISTDGDSLISIVERAHVGRPIQSPRIEPDDVHVYLQPDDVNFHLFVAALKSFPRT